MGHEVLLIMMQITQKIFKLFWNKGGNNEGDYPIKHHATVYH